MRLWGKILHIVSKISKKSTYCAKLGDSGANQDDLIAERDKYGANDVRPGLTGWAQINGRDELEIAEKARFDGEYIRILNEGGWKAFKMDVRCFLGTAISAFRGDGVVEGGTGELKKRENEKKQP